MTTKYSRLTWIAGLALIVSSLAVACGDSNDDNAPLEATTNNGVDAGDSDGGNNDGGNKDGGGSGQVGEPNPDNAVLPDPSDFAYVSEHTFSIDDLLGDATGVTAADDPSLVCTSGCEDDVISMGDYDLYPIDNGWGWDVADYLGAMPRELDGVHDEGWAGNIMRDGDEHIGLAVATKPSKIFKTGPKKGQWCAGLGGDLAKCKSDHYVSMEHVLTCHETVPYMFFDPVTGEASTSDYEACEALSDDLDRDLSTLTEYMFDLENMATGTDYSVINGEHEGEYKVIWGNMDKRPDAVRLIARVALPEEWKDTTKTFRVTDAKLAIVHTVTNNPNDKINPEDLSNEGSTGKLPRYEVDEDGKWVSTVDCYEGDGDFIPAGTVLKNPAFANPDGITGGLQQGYTNAWYTTLDRAPFEDGDNSGPRWRLKAPKFGQDLPSVEIPVDSCTPAPLKKEQVKYERGELTTTVINLLDSMSGAEPGTTPFESSTNWLDQPNEFHSGVTDGNLTRAGVRLTEDFDLSMHIKGEKKPVRLYKAVLYLNYEEVTE